MAINFSGCEIRTPDKPHELQRLYRMLAEVFPSEKKLFEDIINGTRTLYNWEPYTLYWGKEPLGNVSTVMFQLQSGGVLQKAAGIASVATPERYRGMGVAKYIMNHVLKVIETQNLPSLLFTSLPRVYTGLDYQLIDQGVKQAAVKKIESQDRKWTVRRSAHLTSEFLDTIKKLYSGLFPYDGKLFRDEEYWGQYANIINNNDNNNTEFTFCGTGGKIHGYARLEYEADRVLLDEFYVPAGSYEMNTALWNRVCDAAAERNKKLISLALPSTHDLWNFLQVNGLSLEPETGVEREAFMVRMPKQESLKWLTGLRWPLSDKF